MQSLCDNGTVKNDAKPRTLATEWTIMLEWVRDVVMICLRMIDKMEVAVPVSEQTREPQTSCDGGEMQDRVLQNESAM